MVRITVDLLRKNAEHNGGRLSDLKEIWLHQQSIEAIDLIHQACKRLQILRLENNQIRKIQNLYRLKELEYLNLAINSIFTIENLDRCESLKKLDLTLNIISTEELLPSLEHLSLCDNIEQLYLMGNPCCTWEGYRPFTIASLPTLKELDGDTITAAERQQALTQFPILHSYLLKLERKPEEHYRRYQCEEITTVEGAVNAGTSAVSSSHLMPPLPEDGGPPLRQVNQGQWQVRYDDVDEVFIRIEIGIGKYLDSSAIQADVQPRWVRLMIKNKLFQLQLPEEVAPDSCTARRLPGSGALLLTLPKVQQHNAIKGRPAPQSLTKRKKKSKHFSSSINEHLPPILH